jgi:HEAT repeat protein
MNDTLKSLVRILESGKPALQIAAAQVLGEIRAGEPAVVRALAQKLEEGEAHLAPFALEALGQIGADDAVQAIVVCFLRGNALAERAASQLMHMGSAAAKELARLYDASGQDTRAQILDILGRLHHRESLQLLVRTAQSDAGMLGQRASEILLAQAPGLERGAAGMLSKLLASALGPKALPGLAPEAVARLLLVQGAVDGRGARAVLLRFCGPKHPPIVRQAALRALARLELTDSQVDAIVALLDDGDMSHVVRPALEVLEHVDRFGAKSIARLKKSIESGQEEVAVGALRALRSCHTADSARIAIERLTGAAPAVQEAALRNLAGNPAAVEPLLKQLFAERNPERAALLSRPLHQLVPHWAPRHVKQLEERVMKLAPNDPFGEIGFALLLEVAPQDAARLIAEKAVRLRRAKKVQDAVNLLLRLAQSGRIDAEIRYQLALGKLLLESGRNGEAQHPAQNRGDATMGHFAGLLREGFPLFDRIRKESQVTPEDMLRLGTHFAAAVGAERRFGAEVLRFLAEKHRRARTGEDAARALRAEGL